VRGNLKKPMNACNDVDGRALRRGETTKLLEWLRLSKSFLILPVGYSTIMEEYPK
jgi:hypothetical protein